MEIDALGVVGEYMAYQFLLKEGYTILEQNKNYLKLGELDIIAMDGSTLVIVEVKTRSNDTFGHPIESLSKAKIRNILRATEIYISYSKMDYKDIRFDVIAIMDDKIEHIKDAFYGYWN